MANGKRQPAKQKRTNQNRQQRAALQARKEAATVAASSSGGSGSGGGGLLSRLFGGGGGGGAIRTPRPAAGARPVPSRGTAPVGYRAAMVGLIGAVAAVAMSFILSTPVTEDGDTYTLERVVAEWADTARRTAAEAPEADGDEVVDEIGTQWMPNRDEDRLALAAWPASLSMILPVVGAYFAFRAVQRGAGSRVVNRAMYATLFGAILTFGLLTFFLPTVIAVGVAGFQVRRAEVAAALAAQEAEGGGDGDGDVIEAEVVEDSAEEPLDEDDDSAP